MVVGIMTHLLVVGGISSVHDIARRLGAELTLVKTAAAQTMLAPDAYVRIVDVSDHQHSDRVALADEVTEALAGTRFHGILCLHDEAVELGALLAQKLGLSFASPEVAHRTVNKSAMRARLDVTGLGSVAHGVVVDGRVEWSGVAPTSEIVLKPVDGRASRGVTFHRSADELQTWLDTHQGEVEGYLAEERKLGREFSVESLIVRSGDAWHGVTAKTTTGAVESGPEERPQPPVLLATSPRVVRDADDRADDSEVEQRVGEVPAHDAIVAAAAGEEHGSGRIAATRSADDVVLHRPEGCGGPGRDADLGVDVLDVAVGGSRTSRHPCRSRWRSRRRHAA